MSTGEGALIALRIFHAVAALIWLGGGIYYVIFLRPISSPGAGEVTSLAQQRFRDWARPATYIMLASGAILVFDGLSSNTAGLLYVFLLAVKVIAALIAFWLVTVRRRHSSTAPRVRLALALGMSAFVLGVLISTLWPSN